MAKIKIAVQGNKMAVLGSVDLIAGTVGQVCKFYFDEEWRPLEKTIVYKVGSTILSKSQLTGDEAIIPPNVLATAGLPLEIGLTGYTADKSIVTPTSWCLMGNIKHGAITYISGNNNAQDDEVIYDGGGVSSDNENVYEGGGVK